MAGKKWTPWLVGLTGMLSFVGFLDLTQKHQEPEAMAAAESNVSAGEPTVPAEPVSAGQQDETPVRVFMHSRMEFERLSELSPEASAERERELEKMDWSTNGAVALGAAPIQKISPTPSHKNSPPAVSAVPQTAQTSQAAPTKPRSDRRTRRS
jgi:hypothetical protein